MLWLGAIVPQDMDGDDVEIKDFEYRKNDVVEIMKNKASWYLHRYGIIQGLSMSG